MGNDKLEKIKKLDIKEGDTIVIESSIADGKMAIDISDLLNCNVIRVWDINKIGVLKTSTFKQNENK